MKNKNHLSGSTKKDEKRIIEAIKLPKFSFNSLTHFKGVQIV